MKAQLLLLTGHYEMVVLPDSRRVPVPDSMSRGAMTMFQRELFWTDMQEVARGKILPMLQPSDRDEIEAMFDQPEHTDGRPNETESH